MRGTIHECVVRIKERSERQVLLRHPQGGYQLASLRDEYANVVFDPAHKRYDDVICVYNRQSPVHQIYEDAGEPVPGE